MRKGSRASLCAKLKTAAAILALPAAVAAGAFSLVAAPLPFAVAAGFFQVFKSRPGYVPFSESKGFGEWLADNLSDEQGNPNRRILVLCCLSGMAWTVFFALTQEAAVPFHAMGVGLLGAFFTMMAAAGSYLLASLLSILLKDIHGHFLKTCGDAD